MYINQNKEKTASMYKNILMFWSSLYVCVCRTLVYKFFLMSVEPRKLINDTNIDFLESTKADTDKTLKEH